MSDGVDNNPKQRKLGGVTGKGFMPGKSGNPGGRAPIVRDFQEMCREKTPQVIEALQKALENPGERVRAAEVLAAYGYGKPLQRQEHTGANGGPIQTQVVEDLRMPLDTFMLEFATQQKRDASTKH